MDHETEVIRSQMEETRSALAGKIETLENQVVGTVQQATAAVSDTVSTVKHAVEETVGTAKESVHEAVGAIKDTFDIPRQVDRHPWAMFGGSVAVGFLGGCLLPSGRRHRAADNWPERLNLGGRADYQPAESAYREPPRSHGEPSFLSRMGDAFGGEAAKLKGLAVGTMLGLLRDVAMDYLPEQARSDVRNVVDGITEKLGGKVMPSPVMGQFSGNRCSATGEAYPSSERAYGRVM